MIFKEYTTIWWPRQFICTVHLMRFTFESSYMTEPTCRCAKYITRELSKIDHVLRGSGSRALTATGFVNGNRPILTVIESTFLTDRQHIWRGWLYVVDPNCCTKFSANLSMQGFRAGRMREISPIYLFSPLGKLADRAIYFTFRNFIFFKSTKNVSASTGPIFTILSLYERYLRDFFRSGPLFRFFKGRCHGNLFWAKFAKWPLFKTRWRFETDSNIAISIQKDSMAIFSLHAVQIWSILVQ